MPEPDSTTALVDEHVFLVGRPPLGEYLGFLVSQAVNGETLDRGQLANEWRSANDHIRELEGNEAGLADDPPIQELPWELTELAASVERDPMYRKAFALVPTSLKVVELDRLVVFQKHINLEYVKALQNRIGPNRNPAAIFRLCLPVDHTRPGFQRLRITNNAFVFVSPSNDLRFHEPVLLDPGQVSGYTAAGPLSGVVGLVVGFGSNYLNR